MFNNIILNDESFDIEEVLPLCDEDGEGNKEIYVTVPDGTTLLYKNAYSIPSIVIENNLYMDCRILESFTHDMSEGDEIIVPNLGRVKLVQVQGGPQQEIVEIIVDNKKVYFSRGVCYGVANSFEEAKQYHDSWSKKISKFLSNCL